MAKSKGTCKNHPDRESSRKCYQCKKYICPTCQQKHEHHLFCSVTCYFKWKLEPAWKWIKTHREFSFLLLVILISDIFLYILLKPESPRQIEADTTDGTVQVDSGWIRMDTSRVAFNYTLDLKLDVQGINEPVLLWKNGKFISSKKSAKGRLDFGSQYLDDGENRFSLWTMDEQGHTCLLDSFTVRYSSARIDYLKKQVSRVQTSEKRLALTFDGGSSNKTTLNILDTLKLRNIKCTMFLTGRFIKLFPDYVLRIVQDGHEVGNHSFHHPHLTNLEIDGTGKSREYVNREFVKWELAGADSLFSSLTGHHMASLWRAPFGEVNPDIIHWAAEAGYKHINWSLKGDSWDWVADTTSNLYRSSEEIYAHYMDLEKTSGLQGCILLMHLGSERNSDFPYRILGKLIDSLQERGYQLIKVSELLSPVQT